MSSMYRNSSRPSGKKKFGKNLTKVTKAPAPPNPSTANARTSSSRNGLLLLSTKRSSSTSSGGLLSSKTPSSPSKPPQQSLGLKTESYSSAHDALLGAVIGASRMADTQQPPDAWGVSAEKQPESTEPAASKAKDTVESEATSEKPTDGDGAAESTNKKEETETTEDDAAPDARARAEQRRAEEEARFNEQKQRAAERLRQLEQKMSSEKASPVPTVITQRPTGGEGGVLKSLNGNNGAGRDGAAPERARPRTLFDPNRPYSSLVGGNNATTEATGEEAKDARKASPNDDDDEFNRNSVLARKDEDQPPQPVIHISNYETRDRGERNNNAGPRMLFDPKSGSMVAAPSREDAAGRGKKSKVKGRKERGASADGDDNGASTGKPKRGKAGRGKEERRDRRRVDDADATPKDDAKKRGQVRPAEGRLPRTCGVLYKRDERGNCVCVDECDGGDQGYGAHSVPGGRVRNPVEYAKFVAQEKAYQEQDGANGLAYGVAGFDDDHGYYPGQEANFELSEPEPEMLQKDIDWVKPDEKIELVTGANDSPTLQATASTWVPSQAALAAAAAAKEEIDPEHVSGAPKMTPTDDDAEETDEDDDDHPASFVGLGFDPTENMDSVMQSPSVKASKAREIDPVGLSGLALDGPKDGEPATRNIFAFGSSATWGGGAGSTDWTALTEPKSASQGVANDGQDKVAGAASFLSLSTGSPWGSSGLSSGFGGGAAMPGPGGAGQGSTGD